MIINILYSLNYTIAIKLGLIKSMFNESKG